MSLLAAADTDRSNKLSAVRITLVLVAPFGGVSITFMASRRACLCRGRRGGRTGASVPLPLPSPTRSPQERRPIALVFCSVPRSTLLPTTPRASTY